jgi:hypothetical protein
MRIFRTSTARYQPTDNGQGVKKEISRSLPKILKKINEAIENYSQYSPIQVGSLEIPLHESILLRNELERFLNEFGIQIRNYSSLRQGPCTKSLNGQSIKIDVKKIVPEKGNRYAGIYSITFHGFPELKIVLNYKKAGSNPTALDRFSCSITQPMPMKKLVRQKPLVSNLEIDGLASGRVDARVICH